MTVVIEIDDLHVGRTGSADGNGDRPRIESTAAISRPNLDPCAGTSHQIGQAITVHISKSHALWHIDWSGEHTTASVQEDFVITGVAGHARITSGYEDVRESVAVNVASANDIRFNEWKKHT